MDRWRPRVDDTDREKSTLSWDFLSLINRQNHVGRLAGLYPASSWFTPLEECQTLMPSSHYCKFAAILGRRPLAERSIRVYIFLRRLLSSKRAAVLFMGETGGQA